MLRTSHFIISMALILLVTTHGLLSEAVSAEIPVVKAPAGPFKVKLTSLPPYHGFIGAEYALDSLALPYIKDKSIRKSLATILWCGTPTIDYLLKKGRPSEQLLKDRAARIEASWSDGTGDKISPR